MLPWLLYMLSGFCVFAVVFLRVAIALMCVYRGSDVLLPCFFFCVTETELYVVRELYVFSRAQVCVVYIYVLTEVWCVALIVYVCVLSEL